MAIPAIKPIEGLKPEQAGIQPIAPLGGEARKSKGKRPKIEYPQGPTLRTSQIVKLAKKGGDKPHAEPEKESSWLGPVNKVLETLDFLRNETHKLAFGWMFNDEEMASLPTNWAGRTILDGTSIARKMGVDNKVGAAIAGFAIDMLDPLFLVGGPAAKALGTTAGRAGVSHLPSVLKKGIAAIGDASEAAIMQGVKNGARGFRKSLASGPFSALFHRDLDAAGKVFESVLKEAGEKQAAQRIRSEISNRLVRGVLAVDRHPGAAKTAQDFFLQYGRRGYALAHIPFTGIALEIPGVGRMARRFQTLKEVNAATDALLAAPPVGPFLGRAAKQFSAAEGKLLTLKGEVEFGIEQTAPLADLVSKALRPVAGAEKADVWTAGFREFEQHLWGAASKIPLIGRARPSKLRAMERGVEIQQSRAMAIRDVQQIGVEFRGETDDFVNIAKLAQDGKPATPAQIAGFEAAEMRYMKGDEWFGSNDVYENLVEHNVSPTGNPLSAPLEHPLADEIEFWRTAKAEGSDIPVAQQMAEHRRAKHRAWFEQEEKADIRMGDQGEVYTPLVLTSAGRDALREHAGRIGTRKLTAVVFRKATTEQPFTEPIRARLVYLGAYARPAEKAGEWTFDNGPEALRTLFAERPQVFSVDARTGEIRLFERALAEEKGLDELRAANRLYQEIQADEALLAGGASHLDDLERRLGREAEEYKLEEAAIGKIADALPGKRASYAETYGDMSFAPKDLTPQAINRLAENGEMSRVFSPDVVSSVFVSSPLHATAARQGQHRIAMSWRNFEQYISQHAIAVPFGGGGAADASRTLLYDRAALEKLAESKGRKLLDMEYAVPQIPDNSFLKRMTEKPDHVLVMPAPVAERVTRLARIMADDEEMAAMVQFVQKMTSYWKAVTLLDPSWQVVNSTILFNHRIEGARLADMARWTPDMAKLRFAVNAPGDEALWVAGRKYTRSQLMERFKAAGIGVEGYLTTDLPIAVGEAAAAEYSKRTGIHRPSRGWIKRAVGKFFAANQFQDDVFKMSATMSYLEQGHTLQDAVRKALLAGHDYGNIGRAEAQFMPVVIPFYRWLRNNIPFHLYHMAMRPAVYAAVPRAAHAIQTALVGAQSLAPELRPDWFREEIGIQVYGDQRSGYGVMVNPLFPAQEAFELASLPFGVQGPARTATSALNPVIQEAFKAATGLDPFTHRTIEDQSVYGAASRFVGGIRLVRAWPRRIGLVAEGKLGQAAGRTLVGGRFQELSAERGVRNIKGKTAETQRIGISKIKKALDPKNNDRKEAQRLSVELIENLRKRKKYGLTVPKAALPQIGG